MEFVDKKTKINLKVEPKSLEKEKRKKLDWK